MNHSTKKAFTLIELLVVIAIIAILAAILFPVFAQAKQSAKQAQVLSHTKQIGLGQLMYSVDHDDRFSPVAAFNDQWDINSFIRLQQPYMKSLALIMDPFGPAKITDNQFVLVSQWAMPPKVENSTLFATEPQRFSIGWRWTAGQAFTNNERWFFDGIGSINREGSVWIWAASMYVPNPTPSATSSEIARPSQQVMVTQANTHDMRWCHGGTPDSWFRYWGDPPFNLYGDNNMTDGPAARVRATGVDAGIIPVSQDRNTVPRLPTGYNISVATDGSARVQAWRKMMSDRSERGGRQTLNQFWPKE
jgi:prepilin-type N-terminal cleavage/methylation domain-containing protein